MLVSPSPTKLFEILGPCIGSGWKFVQKDQSMTRVLKFSAQTLTPGWEAELEIEFNNQNPMIESLLDTLKSP